MNHCFIVCDLNPEFADRMAEYVNKRRLSPYMMESVTNVQLLEEYGKKRCIDVLLIDEYLYTEDIEKINVEKVFLLVDDRNKLHGESPSCLYKYSSIPDLMNEVMCDYADRNKNTMSTTTSSRTKIIGAFTPLLHPGHSSFLLTMALKIAERKNVFYLNIRSTYGFRKMLNKTTEPDLSDVMYQIKGGHTDIEGWPSDFILNYERFNYVLPPVTITDLQCTETEEWLSLLDAVRKQEYDYIFIDADESTVGCFELLGACDLVYSCCKEEFFDKLAFSELEEALLKIGHAAIADKIIRVSPPEELPGDLCQDFFEILKCGKMSAYVENLLQSQR